MTEQPDTTAIRAKLSSQSMRTLAPRTIIRGLCDALDAARDFEKASERWAALYARAEAAEALSAERLRKMEEHRDGRVAAEARADVFLANLRDAEARIAAALAVLRDAYDRGDFEAIIHALTGGTE